MNKQIKIFCCGCNMEVEPRLTDGNEIYPHRSDLKSIPFWICDGCNNYVGTHHKTKNKTKPLGSIPTEDIRLIRKKIHAVLDPIFKNGNMKRSEIYNILTKKIGKKYHTAEIKSIDEGEVILKILKELRILRHE